MLIGAIIGFLFGVLNLFLGFFSQFADWWHLSFGFPAIVISGIFDSLGLCSSYGCFGPLIVGSILFYTPIGFLVGFYLFKKNY